MIWHRGWDQNKNTFWDKATFTPDPDSNLEEGPKTPFKAVSEIDHIKNGLQINDRMAENFADKTLIDDGNDEFFASLDLADEEKSEESSKHFSNILPMTSTYPKASLNMQQPEMIFGHNSYNPQSTFMWIYVWFFRNSSTLDQKLLMNINS